MCAYTVMFSLSSRVLRKFCSLDLQFILYVHVICLIVFSVISHFGFEDRMLVLLETVPDYGFFYTIE